MMWMKLNDLHFSDCLFIPGNYLAIENRCFPSFVFSLSTWKYDDILDYDAMLLSCNLTAEKIKLGIKYVVLKYFYISSIR